MPSLADSRQNESRGEALETFSVSVDAVAWRKQCGHSDPTEEGWSEGAVLPGRGARVASMALAAPAPTHGPNIPERWKELGVLP